jgi:hypothetical protein
MMISKVVDFISIFSSQLSEVVLLGQSEAMKCDDEELLETVIVIIVF